MAIRNFLPGFLNILRGRENGLPRLLRRLAMTNPGFVDTLTPGRYAPGSFHVFARASMARERTQVVRSSSSAPEASYRRMSAGNSRTGGE